MAHYLLNLDGHASDTMVLRMTVREWLQQRCWHIEPDERHRDALTVGDLALLYLGPPVGEFVGRAELASGVQDATGEVLLTNVEEWDPPAPIAAVLARIDTSAGARAEFDTRVVRITESEYNVAVAVAQARP